MATTDAWWLQEPYKSQLKDALGWARTNPAARTDLDALFTRVKSGAQGPAATNARGASPAKLRARKK